MPSLLSVCKRIRRSRASLNAAASYLAFFSNAAWGLAAIPIAVSFLEPRQLGLWTVVNACLSYLMWMDLGIGNATGRIMADSVAKRDKPEISAWWTTTRAALFTQSAILLLIGLPLVSPLSHMLNVPPELSNDARWLLFGGVIITAVGLTLKGVPGLLTSQHRFHWIPLISAVTPWINLTVFYSLLAAGFGLKSYIFGLAIGQLFTWAAYWGLVWTSSDRPTFSSEGLRLWRYKKLFALSGNMTISGLSDTIIASLPAMIISRMGGLAMVPIYNFSWKGPFMAAGMVSRTYQSFYPGLQRLHVQGERQHFADHHAKAGLLTLGGSLVFAGGILMANTLLVQLLAGEKFYAGSLANMWFAASAVTIPISGFFRILLPISGSMGKQSLVALFKLAVGIVLGSLLWRLCGLPGIASVFVLLPLFNGVYSYFRGTRGCGYRPHELSGSVALGGIASILLVLVCGWAISHTSGSMGEFQLNGKTLTLPSAATVALAAIPVTIGTTIALCALKRLFSNQDPAAPPIIVSP
ncbi:MAG: lipopolysaccharide biosynthesis protein [Verrucomicrobiota bacterium JB025]|nr:hypothetical protein [Verrucomicrobiota bacterium JB025]